MGNALERIADKIKTRILFSINPPPQIVPLCDKEKYGRARRVTDGNKSHVQCMLGN